jgi:UDP-N-acetyl-D-glucosamine dehydrogenase
MKFENTIKSVQEKKCIIEIYGLGYVGLPLSIKLAIAGFNVKGIDNDENKIERLKKNNLLSSEKKYEAELTESIKKQKLEFLTKKHKTEQVKIGIVCVPTPSPSKNIQSDIFVKDAIEQFLAYSKTGDIIIIESSIEVGTTENLIQIIHSKGFKVGDDFGLIYCPERIDPQNTKWNLDNIPRIIYASDDATYKIAIEIYKHVNSSKMFRVESPKIAEVVKSFENTFRLVNISLVNELAMLCDKLQINVNDVIDAASTKPFGFMPFYPSAGVGGHCIPKDPKFLLKSASKFGINFKTIDNALKINDELPKYIVSDIEKEYDKSRYEKTILVYGLSYKPNIEDMRDSPGFRIINELKSRGFKVFSYDPYYKKDLVDKYVKENYLIKKEFTELDDISDNSLKCVSGICIVQNHLKDKKRLEEIYRNAKVFFIYDCQGKIKRISNSETKLKRFGS